MFYYFRAEAKALQALFKHFGVIFTENDYLFWGENEHMKSKIQIVLTPVQIYVVVLPTVRFFSVKRASDGARAF